MAIQTTATQTILITGANRGIGLEYVRQYAESGNQVYATVRDLAQATSLQQLAAEYSNIEVLALDVADIAAIRELAGQLSAITVDILISNAGTYPESSFGKTDPQAWLHAFQVNTLTTYYLAEAFLPQLRRASQAKLIAMTSKMGSIEDNSSGGEYIYRSSKTALNMVVKSLALDLKEFNIAVAALHPGWVRTDMGGPNGLIDTATSVRGLRQVIEQLTCEQSGQFIAYDGKLIPW
ncbi:SDR family oxidoreductase [Methylophilus sp. TWE2]|jgi:NAD(P)-dependent dehydrogenase (short-subunit alcohol dehydrogenase family)|uniref:SDR family oxidoreductase n=1 Tax=Methylophilus sp. TWE2 TaxID=1662285 RepID=UPI0006714F0E|nr:SDR family oxidoreductase [Methylophilus sp. TWE2]AKR43936.1 short-chain dehydrogenase [Methylophilus sp. TWE2]